MSMGPLGRMGLLNHNPSIGALAKLSRFHSLLSLRL